jgi:hypothetical protein
MIPGDAGTTLKTTGPLGPPAVVTDTLCEANAAWASTVNWAVILVVEETLGLLTVTPKPVIFTVVAPTTKLVPVKVTDGALPVTLVLGDIAVSVGAGVGAALTVKDNALVVPTDVITLTL